MRIRKVNKVGKSKCLLKMTSIALNNFKNNFFKCKEKCKENNVAMRKRVLLFLKKMILNDESRHSFRHQ